MHRPSIRPHKASVFQEQHVQLCAMIEGSAEFTVSLIAYTLVLANLVAFNELTNVSSYLYARGLAQRCCMGICMNLMALESISN